MVTLLQLSARLGPALQTGTGAPPPAAVVSGVHLSELADPSPYLEGGELLLTTGIPLHGGADRIAAYVARLVDAGVAGLVVGLGEGLDTVPRDVVEQCSAVALPVLHVPDGVPFQRVTRAFWDLVGESGRAGVLEQLGTQTRLARAAGEDDALRRIVEILGQSLGGWAAYLPLDDAEETVFWPDSLSGIAPQLRPEVERLFGSAGFAAATFQAEGRDVIGYPISTRAGTTGALVVGAGRAPSRTDKQLVLTAQALLGAALRSRDGCRPDGESTDATTPGRLCARLLVDGHVEAARLLAGEVGVTLPARVRVTARSLDDAGHGAEAVRAVPAHALVTELDGVRFMLHDADVVAEAAVHASAHATAHASALADVPSVALAGVRDACWRLAALLTGPAAHPAGELGLSRALQRVAELQAYDRAPLVETVREYLRTGRSWEDTSRLLGVHRNTVRHRIDLVERLLDVSLDDPDVGAELWLVLRMDAEETGETGSESPEAGPL